MTDCNIFQTLSQDSLFQSFHPDFPLEEIKKSEEEISSALEGRCYGALNVGTERAELIVKLNFL